MNQVRYASLKGIMAAKKKPIDVKTAADLGLAGQVGAGAAKVKIEKIYTPPKGEGAEILSGIDRRGRARSWSARSRSWGSSRSPRARRSPMGSILVVAEIQKGKIREASYELVAFAQKIGGRASEVDEPRDRQGVAGEAEELAKKGGGEVLRRRRRGSPTTTSTRLTRR